MLVNCLEKEIILGMDGIGKRWLVYQISIDRVKYGVLPLSAPDKLEDAFNANGNKSEVCTLIITEGDSAKQLVAFTNNMLNKSAPFLTNCNESKNWTRITFKPDLGKFNMDTLDGDVLLLMQKRIVDVVYTLGSSIKMISNESFKDYVEINFVNLVATFRGGKHVDCIVEQFSPFHNIDKAKDARIEAGTLENHLWVFVNARIKDPTFETQKKAALKGGDSLRSDYIVSNEMFNNASKAKIADDILSLLKKLKHVPMTLGNLKLEDAFNANRNESEDCSLILTKGDSANNLLRLVYQIPIE